jgi:general stress protein 26
MVNNNLKEIASKISKLDICMLTTRTTGGMLTSRPMSNNGDVEYDGNSYFLTFDQSQTVKHRCQS